MTLAMAEEQIRRLERMLDEVAAGRDMARKERDELRAQCLGYEAKLAEMSRKALHDSLRANLIDAVDSVQDALDAMRDLVNGDD